MAICKNKKISALTLILWAATLPLYATEEANVIVYTTTDGKVLNLSSPVPGAEIDSNYVHPTGSIRLVFRQAVTALTDNAFAGQKTLRTIALPPNVTTLGKGAFEGCTSLKTITWDNQIAHLGANTFADCRSLTSLVFPHSVTALPDKVCYLCSMLQDVTLPDGLTEIGAYAFSGDSSLTRITWPQTLTRVGDYCMTGCPNLQSIISLAPAPPQGLHNLTMVDSTLHATLYYMAPYEQAYENNQNLNKYTTRRVALTDRHKLTYKLIPKADHKSFRVGNSFNATLLAVVPDPGQQTGSIYFAEPVTVIGMEAFKNSYQLLSITLPDQITGIEQGAFENCTSLTTIAIGQNVRYVDKQAFAGCNALTQITLPHATKTIGDKAFKNCAGLQKIVLGFGMTDIGYNAFENCTAMDTVISYSYLPPRLASSSVFLWMKPDASLLVPEESMNDYKKGTWGQYYQWKNILSLVQFSFARQLAVNETIQLTSHLQPQDESKHIEWKSSDPTIVSVDATGKVTALKNSNNNPITITATVSGTDVTEQVQLVIVDKVNKEPAKYTIDVADYAHGQVQLSCTQAVAGTPVFVTIKPDEGYGLQTLTVETKSKQPVSLYRSLSTEGKYQFILPASNVVVTPIFVAL